MTSYERALAAAWEHGTAEPGDEDRAREAAARRAALDLYDTDWR